MREKKLQVNHNDKVEICLGIAEEIRTLHSKSQVHGGLSDETILVNASEKRVTLTLTGLDLLKYYQKKIPTSELQLKRGAFFLAPERFKDPAQASLATDIYSLGCVFTIIFSDRDLWENKTFESIQQEISKEHPLADEIKKMDVYPELREVISDCIHINEKRRPTIGNIIQALKIEKVLYKIDVFSYIGRRFADWTPLERHIPRIPIKYPATFFEPPNSRRKMIEKSLVPFKRNFPFLLDYDSWYVKLEANYARLNKTPIKTVSLKGGEVFACQIEHHDILGNPTIALATMGLSFYHHLNQYVLGLGIEFIVEVKKSEYENGDGKKILIEILANISKLSKNRLVKLRSTLLQEPVSLRMHLPVPSEYKDPSTGESTVLLGIRSPTLPEKLNFHKEFDIRLVTARLLTHVEAIEWCQSKDMRNAFLDLIEKQVSENALMSKNLIRISSLKISNAVAALNEGVAFAEFAEKTPLVRALDSFNRYIHWASNKEINRFTRYTAKDLLTFFELPSLLWGLRNFEVHVKELRSKSSAVSGLELRTRQLLQQMISCVEWTLQAQNQAGKPFSPELCLSVLKEDAEWMGSVRNLIKDGNVARAELDKYREALVKWKETRQKYVPMLAPKVSKAIEDAGFKYQFHFFFCDRFVCEVCQVAIVGWKPWHTPELMHDFTKHPPGFNALAVIGESSAEARAKAEADSKDSSEGIITMITNFFKMFG